MNTTPRRLGKYELQEPLGRGGMAEVWKALDTQLRRPVAIKLLHANLQADPDFVTRFMHEAQVIAALRHPNIVQIYDFHISENSPASNSDVDAIAYMVMEYIRGNTLAAYISNTSYKKDIPSSDTVVRLFTPISSALDYAHQQGTIHRDIKPANILLDQQNTVRNPMGEPILSDFGLAKLLNAESQTLTATVFGTPLYISPEQVQGKPVSARSDLYSLGVILYEIFTGVRPFQAESVTAIMLKQLNEIPPAPHLVNPNLPPALSDVILKSIAKDPQQRYSSASAMTAAVAQAFDMTVPLEIQQAASATSGAYLPASDRSSDAPRSSNTSETFDEATVRAPRTLPEQHAKPASTPAVPPVKVENRRNPTSSAGIERPFTRHDQEMMSEETIAASPETNTPTQEPLLVQETQRASVSDTPLPAIPLPPVPTAATSPASPVRPRRRGLLIAGIIVLICVLIGSGLTALLLLTRHTQPSAVSTVVGSANFVSSHQVNETTNQGANDEFQINLHGIAQPASGKSYYGWLLPDNTQVEGSPVLLGKLPVNNGNINFMYSGDGQHTNLLATTSRFLITEEDANTTPVIPSPDQTMWRYYAEIPQIVPAGQTFSLLSHLRHLLADDLDLQKLQTPIPGGLAIWMYRNTQKLVYWSQTAMNAWNAHDYDTVHKRVVEVLDYTDGSSMVSQDVPAGTPLLADPIPSQVPLLQLQANQQHPGYFYHVAVHLQGVVQSPGSTQYQQKLAEQINLLLGRARTSVEQVRQDAKQLVTMSNTQLAQSEAQTLLNDMLMQAGLAFSGQSVSSTVTPTANGGVTLIYKDIQLLASFEVKPFSQNVGH